MFKKIILIMIIGLLSITMIVAATKKCAVIGEFVSSYLNNLMTIELHFS